MAGHTRPRLCAERSFCVQIPAFVSACVSVCACVCVRACVCMYVCICVCEARSSTPCKFKLLVGIQSCASACSKQSGDLNKLTLLLSCIAQSPVRDNNKVKLFRPARRGFCDTIHTSAQTARHINRAMCVLGVIAVVST